MVVLHILRINDIVLNILEVHETNRHSNYSAQRHHLTVAKQKESTVYEWFKRTEIKTLTEPAVS